MTAEVAQATLCARVQRLLMAASRDVLPARHATELWQSPRSGVVASEASASAGDLECRAPSVLWRRLLAEQRGGASVRLVTTSEYGLMREAEYGGAAELGKAMLAGVEMRSRCTRDTLEIHSRYIGLQPECTGLQHVVRQHRAAAARVEQQQQLARAVGDVEGEE